MTANICAGSVLLEQMDKWTSWSQVQVSRTNMPLLVLRNKELVVVKVTRLYSRGFELEEGF
jgi:hypothetical protein